MLCCITELLYKPSLCKEHPNWLFVFGDNIAERGKAGQAIIRDEPNTFGIPTKWFPNMKETSFFSDLNTEFALVNSKINHLLEKQKNYDVVVFPVAGLGTGLAQMQIHSPKLYKHMISRFKNEFGLEGENY